METLGIVMAKADSQRLPDKNIADLCGKPMMAYPIEILRKSGVCDNIVVSTNSEDYEKIALEHGADSVVIRETEWADSTKYGSETFRHTVQETLKRFEEQSGQKFDTVAFIGGNVVFLRPSWIRAAAIVLNQFHYNGMPIDLVTCDVHLVCVGVCHVKPVLFYQNAFNFYHSGITLDIDWEDELRLTRQIMESIQRGDISYPLDEDVHETRLKGRFVSPAQYKGLTER